MFPGTLDREFLSQHQYRPARCAGINTRPNNLPGKHCPQGAFAEIAQRHESRYDARGNLRSRTYTPEQVPFEWDDYEEGYVAYVSLGSISYNNSPVTVTVDNARLMNGDPVTITGTFNNTSTGINNAAAGEGGAVVKVYGVDGRLVKEGAAPGVLDGLEKGVYIVNGKKVLAE